MNKNLLHKTLVVFLLTPFTVSLSAQISDPAPYCPHTYGGMYNMMEDLTVNDFQYSFGAPGELFGDEIDFTYYNNIDFPEVQTGSAVSIDINFYQVNDVGALYFALWVDFNQNNIFEDSERVLENSNTIMNGIISNADANAPSNVNSEFLVPLDAVLGSTRMRLARGTNLDNPFMPYDNDFSMTACTEDPVGFLQGNIYDFDLIISDSANSIAENTNESPIKVHPNPASSELILTAVGDQPLYNEIKIVSMEGKVVLEQQINTLSTSINIQNLEAGLYYIQIFKDSQIIASEQLIKN
ncbi:MAG: T9SS type A sorting domain-containing protein [Flavobacteriales bacterium]|jgi:hypothetical protein|tara:strand:- start:925 stop:1815 length:891 start_codon:yes stop_codon:yes gene_type:complete